MNSGKQILLIAPEGALADGLLAVLSATSEITLGGEIHVARDVDPGRSSEPNEVLLDGESLGQNVRGIVREIRALWPHAQCLVLATDVAQADIAQQAGADAVLIAGCKPSDLLDTVERLLALS